MEVSPITSMKKGWLCITSYDEKNWDIAPFDWDSRAMMIQLWWWSSDDLALMMIQLCSGFDDDPEKKTCADELCQENTFLVKRECWCICNFGMYSLVYFICCISLYPDVPIGRIINVIKSCKVIEVNPPLEVGTKYPQLRGARVIRLSYWGRPW